MEKSSHEDGAKLELGWIGEEQLQWFQTLMLPQAREALQQGEPLTAIGLFCDRVACGALVGYVDTGCFYVVSLYVAPDYRRRGGASWMIRTLEAQLEKADHMYAVELRFTVTDAENETLHPFLEHLGFEVEDDGARNIYAFTLEEVMHAKELDRDISAAQAKTHKMRALSQLSDDQLRAMQKRAVALEAPIPEKRLSDPEVERDLSLAWMVDGRAEAYVIFDHSCCGVLTLSALWAGDAGAPVAYALLKTALQRAAELYPPQTQIALQVVNSQSARLMHGLLPEAEKISYTYRYQFR